MASPFAPGFARSCVWRQLLAVNGQPGYDGLPGGAQGLRALHIDYDQDYDSDQDCVGFDAVRDKGCDKALKTASNSRKNMSLSWHTRLGPLAHRIAAGYTGCMKHNFAAILALHASAAFAFAGQAQRLNNVHFTEKSPLGTLAIMAERRFISRQEPSPSTDYSLEEKSFEIAIPSGYDSSTPAPLFVWISATDGGGPQDAIRRALEKRGWLYAGANGSGNDHHTAIRASLALDAVHNMCRQYNVNSNLVFIGGISGGGRMASELALVYADVFKGGGFYVIGCNCYDPIPAPGGRTYPGFWPKKVPDLFTEAKRHWFVFLTGSKDFNQPGTIGTYEAYKGSGFEHCFYNETPELAHAMPPAEDIEKGFAFLDAAPLALAKQTYEAGRKAAGARDFPKAAECYRRAKAAGLEEAKTAWDELVAAADKATDAAIAQKEADLGAAIVQLRKIAAAYGCAAEKASTALADIESSPAFAAEKQAAARFIAIRSAARTTPRDKTVADLRALVEELPDTRAAAEARAVIQKLTP